tara:strand:- start:326 stop:1372 length:1047 start_codon:yes stop_codon:yes gene_type:complete
MGNGEICDLNQNKDKENTVNFLNLLLPIKIDLKRFDWEFLSASNSSIFKIIKIKNQILGTQSLIPISLLTNKYCLKSTKSEVSYIDQSLRGKGYFKTILNECINDAKNKDISLVWALTPATKPYRKIGFNCFTDFIFRCTINTEKPKWENIQSILKYLYKWTFYHYFKLILLLRNPSINIELKSAKNNKKDLRNLQLKMNQEFGDCVQFELSERNLNWRIRTNPIIKYDELLFYAKSEIIGYAILCKHENITYISCLQAKSKVLLERVIHKIFQQSSLGMICYLGNKENLFNETVQNIFNSYGGKSFLQKDTPFVYKLIEDDSPLFSNYLNSKKNWLINGLWTEGTEL